MKVSPLGRDESDPSAEGGAFEDEFASWSSLGELLIFSGVVIALLSCHFHGLCSFFV